MKKLLSIILIFTILASCCSCTNSKEKEYAVSVDFDSAQSLYNSVIEYMSSDKRIRKSELKVRLAQYFTDGLSDLVLNYYYDIDEKSGFVRKKDESFFRTGQGPFVCNSIIKVEMIESGVAKIVNRAYEVNDKATKYEDFYKACYDSEYILIYDKTWKFASFGIATSGDYLKDEFYADKYKTVANQRSEQIDLTIGENGVDANGIDKDMHLHPWLVNHEYSYQCGEIIGCGPVYLYDKNFNRSEEVFDSSVGWFEYIDNSCPAVAITADNRIIRIWHEEFKEIYKSEQELLPIEYENGELSFCEGDDLIVLNIDTLDVQKKHYDPISNEAIDAMKALCLEKYEIDFDCFTEGYHWDITESVYSRSIKNDLRYFSLYILSDKYGHDKLWAFHCCYNQSTGEVTNESGYFDDWSYYVDNANKPYKQKELSPLQKEITEAVILHIPWYDDFLKNHPIDKMTIFHHWDWNVDELEQNKWNVSMIQIAGTGAYSPVEFEVTKQDDEYLVELIEDRYDPSF